MRGSRGEQKDNGQGQEHTSKRYAGSERESSIKKSFHVLLMLHMLICFICLKCLSVLWTK